MSNVHKGIGKGRFTQFLVIKGEKGRMKGNITSETKSAKLLEQ